MQSVQVGMWDPLPPSKQHGSPLAPSHQPQPRLSHVSAPPAKRITFYKSGDSQFGGVKMAIHKRSFKCFDALLDDLSQKVPLPFGVRTVTTPRGTHTISHLEQLQDGGCYLCSDRRHAKPINMDVATRHPRTWSHQGRRPHRPDSDSATPPGHVPYRQRRLLLVKNTEPAVRRSVVLSRRVTRSLRAFLEEVSDVMQFHVRKLYTVEGRKIDNVQNLMTCPNVLVCVGREAFSPLLVNYIRKSSDEKLPGLGTSTPGNGTRSPPHGAQSRASENSEGQDSKKNMVNFGLETKKSIIHPRSDSSTRSARFSMSSDKSYGLSTVSQGRAAILNDDIEKRVVVNKDGSLSVEMRVRFRLQSDETLQWSTRIKKSPSLTNDSCSASQGQPHYLQPESCSDPDCNSYDPETADYSTQCVMDANRCECCYRQEQQYDLWENPVHSHEKPVPPPHSTTENHTILRHTQSSSSCSSCNSTRLVRCRARLTHCEDGSERSQIVQEEMCVSEQHIVEQEVCTVSRSCSRSEVVVTGDELRPHSCKSGEEDVERPMSAISASSHVLQELKEDDEEELPPSASRCSRELSPTSEIQIDDKPVSVASAKQNGVDDGEEASTCQCYSTSGVETNERVSTAKSKAGSCKSVKETTMDEVEEVSRVLSGLSAGQSVSSLCPNCGGWKVRTSSGCNSRASNRSITKSPKPAIPNSASQDKDDSGSDVSELSNRSNLTSQREVNTISNEECNTSLSKTEEGSAEEIRATSVASSHKSNNSHKDVGENDEIVENRSLSVISAMSDHSNCKVSPDLSTRDEVEEENASERVASAMSAKSCISAKTSGSRKSMIKVTPPSTAEDEEENKPTSVQSERSDMVDEQSRPTSTTSTKSQEKTRAASVLSVESNQSAQIDRPASANSTTSQNEKCQMEHAEEETRAASALSVKSNESRSASPMSVKSSKSSENEFKHLEVKSNKKESRPGSVLSVKSSVKSDVSKKSDNTKEETRASSAISVKSDVSGKTSKSHISENERVEVKSSASAKESRPTSEISNKSASSRRSSKNKVQNADEDTRAESVRSAKSNTVKESRPTSVISGKSSKSYVSEKSSKTEKFEEETRPVSVTSSKSNSSNKTKESSKTPRSNVEKDEEESIVSRKSRNSSKLNCEEAKDKGERSASAVSSKSSLSVKSSRSASPAKVKEEERALSSTSGKTHSSTISAKSKKSNQTVISTKVNEDNDNKSERVMSPVSIKSGTSRTFHVITIKTPEVINRNSPASSVSTKTSSPKENKMAGDETEDAHTSLVEDEAPKSEILNQNQELLPENVEQRVSSSLSVHSGKSGKSGKSKCSCEKKEKKDQVERESPKREDYEDDSFASVSLVLPEDHDSESGESSVPSRYKIKTATPEVPKSPEDVVDVQQVGPNNPDTKDIPTIETPGDNHEDTAEETTRVASSCSTKSTHSVRSTKSKKSCRSCAKMKTKVDSNGTASPVASVKSIATTRTGQLTAPDNRTTSAMSCASSKSQRKLTQNGEIDKASEEGSEEAGKDKEETKVARAKSKSPCRLRPKSSGSNKSKTNSGKGMDDNVSVHSVKSSQSKEENVKSQSPQNVSRPASKGDTCSESILSHSLSAADLLKEENAKPLDRPRSKCSKSSIKSTKSQRSKREAVLELTPSCLPNASPNEVVSDWLKSIPANVLALVDEEGSAEKSGEAMAAENDVGAEDEDNGDEEKAEDIERGKKEEAKAETFEIRPNGTVPEASLPKNWHPSSAVMKVLLSSSLGRCRSMPEVSPVYGRRLSTSAKELLDCLTQLQLIEPAGQQSYSVQKDQHPQFEDIISILQSLWINEPKDITVDPKDPSRTEQVSPPRSSSGVGMSSGSGGSGKDNGNQEDDAKPDEEVEVDTEDVSGNPDSPKEPENPSSLDKNSNSPTDNDTHEASTSESPPTAMRAPLSKHKSQDPDPVWVLHLLKKLEKQFINHYVNAMADFKVKWDLEDNLILDRMIVELKDEVSQRIEKSVDREFKKIHGRAGKGMRVPRPPQMSHLSQESSMTEKRRQRLMVMKKQSVKTGDSMSDGELTGDNSDQRSDDEYCPCETCIRKKMAARPFKTNPNAIEAPVHMEFDLFRILQHKKSPPAAAAMAEIAPEQAKGVVEEECRNLEVVQEEEEEEESKAEADRSDSEEAKCRCDCREEDSDEQTEESDKETVREKSLQNEIGEEAAEGEEGGGENEETTTEERTSDLEAVSAVCGTEGEDADVEDSGTEEKSDHETIQTETRDKSDILPSKPKVDVSLLHQCTRTSVESQPGSLEDLDNRPSANNKEVTKLASPGGTAHKRSRSPARVKRRKAMNSDSDMENI